MLRSLALGFAAFSCAGLALAVAASTACFTAPPDTLPQPPLTPPTILHDAVVPPAGEILASLPAEFLVPVRVDSADEPFQWDVFVDYDPCPDGICTSPTQPAIFPVTVNPTPGTLDGGVTIVPFSLGGGVDPSMCHRIDFLVALQFDDGFPHTPNSAGGDIVTWIYNGSGGPNGCPEYDAGPLQDGAFPASDAGGDGPLVAPESGAGDL